MKRNQAQAVDLPVRWVEGEVLVLDTMLLNGTQRLGLACVVCGKRWPRPAVTVGIVPDGRQARACEGCADLMPTPAEAARAGEARAGEARRRARVGRLRMELIADVLRQARGYLPQVWADPLAAIAMAAGMPHAGPQSACCKCAVIAECAGVLTAHLQRTDSLVGQDRKPRRVCDDAVLWLVAWTAEGAPVAVVAEVFDAVVAELVEALEAMPS